MKNKYSRLCLKERWITFAITFLVSICGFVLCIFTALKDDVTLAVIIGLVSVIILLIAIGIYVMNLRRRSIKKEYNYEFDKEIFSKERSCPTCGTKLSSNSCYCPGCSKKFH